MKLFQQDLSMCRIAHLTVPCPSHEKLQHKANTDSNAANAKINTRGSAIVLPVHSYMIAKEESATERKNLLLKS